MSDEKRDAKFWLGWILTALPALALAVSAAMKLSHALPILANWDKFGYPLSTLTPIGAVELLCALLLLIPRTTVLGAVLVTGYLGGAIATHVRVSDPGFVTPLVIALVAWLGVYLREPRVRALLPLR